MFQNAALDIAIGLALMYLMLSLLCTVANEYIATKLRIRANTLADALQKMIDDPTLRSAFYQNGMIISNASAAATGAQTTISAIASGAAGVKNMITSSPLPPPAQTDPTQDHPSYLSGRTVALAVMGSLDTSKPIPEFNDLKTAVEKMGDSSVRDALLASLTEAQGSIDKLRTSVATWFDDSMERLSGAYKRKLTWISMLTGLVVAIGLNADSFKVAAALYNDPVLRASVVTVATETAKKALPETGKDVDEAKLKAQVERTQDTLRGLPIGWQCVPAGSKEASWHACLGSTWPAVFLQILGWFLTAAALSLGAPFWFDLLNKFVNIRGAGSKPARTDAK
jgi:hypothetical protein